MNFKYSMDALSESSIHIDFGNKISLEINQLIFRLFQYFSHHPFSGFQEAIPAYAALTISYNPLRTPYTLIELKHFITKTIENITTIEIVPSKTHEIPVAYTGEDLEYIAHYHNMTIQDVVLLHISVTYRVYMLGFLPGFLYLGGLPQQLNTPRRDTPRPLVAAGSVGIGGSQTGVYPLDSPGGWHIIGRTNFGFFDASKTPPSPFHIGDQVKFVPVKICSKLNQPKQPIEVLDSLPDLMFIKSGILSTIQDLGRFNFQHLGVNPNGVMDYKALRLLNILLMNSPNEAVIEMHFPAAEIQFNTSGSIAIGGGDFRAILNDKPVSNWQSFDVVQGDILKFKQKISGQRIYVAVAGGFKVKALMNSCSTNILAHFGGKKIKNLDGLYFKKKAFIKNQTLANSILPHYQKNPHIRFIKNPEFNALTLESSEKFISSKYVVKSDSNRMAYILSGEALMLSSKVEVLSSAVSFGTIQLLPNGLPIILMADHQTTGGYPKLGTVIKIDLPLLAQLAPGDTIQFECLELEDAKKLFLQEEKQYETLQENLKLLI